MPTGQYFGSLVGKQKVLVACNLAGMHATPPKRRLYPAMPRPMKIIKTCGDKVVFKSIEIWMAITRKDPNYPNQILEIS